MIHKKSIGEEIDQHKQGLHIFNSPYNIEVRVYFTEYFKRLQIVTAGNFSNLNEKPNVFIIK